MKTKNGNFYAVMFKKPGAPKLFALLKTKKPLSPEKEVDTLNSGSDSIRAKLIPQKFFSFHKFTSEEEANKFLEKHADKKKKKTSKQTKAK